MVSGKVAARSLSSLAAKSTEDISELPVLATVLHHPYPNPFNPQTTIRFDLKDATHTRINIYNLQGRLVRTLEDARLPTGRYSRIWNGVDSRGIQVSSGVYFVRMEVGADNQVRRVALVR